MEIFMKVNAFIALQVLYFNLEDVQEDVELTKYT
jgi:hypothetical protein